MVGLGARAALTCIGHELKGNVWLRASRYLPIPALDLCLFKPDGSVA